MAWRSQSSPRRNSAYRRPSTRGTQSNMNAAETLAKLLELKELVERLRNETFVDGDERRRVHDNMVELYGEVAPVFEQVVGKLSIRVPPGSSGGSVFPNYFEAGYLSGRTFHVGPAYNELLKVIGAVKGRVSSPAVPQEVERSLASVIGMLQRLRECCQYVR